MTYQNLVPKIIPLDQSAMDLARTRQNNLTKPRGSLGRLEELSIQVAGIFADSIPAIRHKVVIVMAGDHGVVQEGVSAYPSEVTAQMVANFLNGGAAINVLARHYGARVVIVDMGVASDLLAHPKLVVRKIGPGTANISRGPAMSSQQAADALLAGAEIAYQEIELGMDILATGEMGIGNTTPAAAIAAVLTGQALVNIAGRGTGVDDAGLDRKINAIEKAIQVNQPNPQDALDVLAKVGGFEIAGLAGAILATASRHRPIVIDGYISTAAAMIAVLLEPQVQPYLIAAHTSQERGHSIMLDWLGLNPLIDLKLRLGEGTGAVIALSLVEAACKILGEMATFEQAGVSDKD